MLYVIIGFNKGYLSPPKILIWFSENDEGGRLFIFLFCLNKNDVSE